MRYVIQTQGKGQNNPWRQKDSNLSIHSTKKSIEIQE
jgi:hypothetical protein